MSDLNNSLYYTERAAAARRLAISARDASIRSIHEGTAARYDGLAIAAEIKVTPIPIDGRFRNERRFDSITTARRQPDSHLHDAIALMVTDALPQMIWSTLPDGYHDYYNAQWYEFTGVDPGSTDGDGWNGMFHVNDRERVWAQWQHCLATGEPYEVHYRLRRHDGEYLWMLGRALPMRGKSGDIIRWVGTCTDIHEARTIADQNALLSEEMNHRVANIFAIIGSLVALESRVATSVPDLSASIQSRLTALNAAHRLVQSSGSGTRRAIDATLQSIIRAVMDPYEDAATPRFAISGPDIILDKGVVTAIALVFHELCTNAVKYGALAPGRGTVTITTRIEGPAYQIDWTERGGPLVAKEPIATGFGTTLTKVTVEQQLSGAIERRWSSDGLEVRLSLASAKLAGLRERTFDANDS